MKPRLRYSEAGNILVLAAFVLPVLLGVAALALDVGYFFDCKQRAGAAADAAAIAGAFELRRTGDLNVARSYALDDAERNGFTNGTDEVTVTVARVTCAGSPNCVQVVVSQTRHTFLMPVFGMDSVTIVARAVAGPDVAPGSVSLVADGRLTVGPERAVYTTGPSGALPGAPAGGAAASLPAKAGAGRGRVLWS